MITVHYNIITEVWTLYKAFSRKGGPTNPNSETNRHCMLLKCTKGYHLQIQMIMWLSWMKQVDKIMLERIR